MPSGRSSLDRSNPSSLTSTSFLRCGGGVAGSLYCARLLATPLARVSPSLSIKSSRRASASLATAYRSIPVHQQRQGRRLVERP